MSPVGNCKAEDDDGSCEEDNYFMPPFTFLVALTFLPKRRFQFVHRSKRSLSLSLSLAGEKVNMKKSTYSRARAALSLYARLYINEAAARIYLYIIFKPVAICGRKLLLEKLRLMIHAGVKVPSFFF